MAEHDLKICTEFFQPIRDLKKTFEIRKNDRDYKVGDTARLREYDWDHFTGKEVRVRITYVTKYMQREGYVVFGINVLTNQ